MALGRASTCGTEPETLAVEFVQSLDRIDDAAEVTQSFRRLIESLGYTHFVCLALPPTRRLNRSVILHCTWPADCLETYIARGYAKHDPVLRRALLDPVAFDWPDAFETRALTRREREVMRLRTKFGMCAGRTVPIPEAGGNLGIVSLAGEQPCADDRCRSVVTLVSMYVYHRLQALAAAAREAIRAPLSPREIEVLHWIAEGKSDWQIGRILSISAKTVNYHTENLKRKLGVATRAQAIVSAIQQGAFVPGELGLVLPQTSRENRNSVRRS